MKRWMLGMLVGIGLAATVAAQQTGQLFPSPVPVQPASLYQAISGSELIVVPASAGERGQILTVIDPLQKVMGVYLINLETGKIALKSVRKIQWDLQITDFNTENPLPREIQSRLEER